MNDLHQTSAGIWLYNLGIIKIWWNHFRRFERKVLRAIFVPTNENGEWRIKYYDELYTGLFKTIVGVLTTCHTQYTWDRSICIFFNLIEQHSKLLWHTLQVLYMCTLCDSTNINTKIEFVPNCL
jgi:hypothetical protein